MQELFVVVYTLSHSISMYTVTTTGASNQKNRCTAHLPASCPWHPGQF